MKRYLLSAACLLAFAACGGGEPDSGTPNTGATTTTSQPAAPALPPAPTGPMSIPDWYSVDNDARTVNMTVTAGSTADNNYWNYNGAINGDVAINVPEGYTVTIEFVNQDPNMAHSLGIQADFTNPMLPPTPNPVFEGAVSENPQSMIDATMPGETETLQFVADTAGEYTMICYIAGHTAIGMWLYFNVTSDGSAGIQTR